jgi:hypothetical protein
MSVLSSKRRIINLEKKFPVDDSQGEFLMIIDARTKRSADIQKEIESYRKTPPYSSLSAREIKAFLHGEVVETTNPDTGRPLKLVLANPVWNSKERRAMNPSVKSPLIGQAKS